MLEEDVVVFTAVADGGVLGVQGMVAELPEFVPVDKLRHVVKVQNLNFLNLMAGAEAVEEMLHREMSLDGGEVGHRAHVHAFLHTGRGQLCPAALTAGHDVGVIAENGDRMRPHRARRHVHDRRQLQARNAVHRRDHQHQALGRCVRGRQRTGLQHPLQRAAGAGFGLHLDNPDLGAEDVLHAVGRPLIYMGRHGTGRGNGVDGGRLRKGIGDV